MHLQAYSWNPSTLYLRPVLVLIDARREGATPIRLGLWYRIRQCYSTSRVAATHNRPQVRVHMPLNYHRYLLVNQWALHRSVSGLSSLQGSMPD